MQDLQTQHGKLVDCLRMEPEKNGTYNLLIHTRTRILSCKDKNKAVEYQCNSTKVLSS